MIIADLSRWRVVVVLVRGGGRSQILHVVEESTTHSCFLASRGRENCAVGGRLHVGFTAG